MKVSDQPHNTTSIIPPAMRALVLYSSLTGNTHKVARAMIRALQGLPPLHGVRAAVFGTYGAWPRQRRKLERLLAANGMEIIGQFFCPGVDLLFYPLRAGRPSEEDLKRARAFARQVSEGVA